jgi:hypothetical protein
MTAGDRVAASVRRCDGSRVQVTGRVSVGYAVAGVQHVAVACDDGLIRYVLACDVRPAGGAR